MHYIDFRKLESQYRVFLRAAETDDELGTVLRLHLLVETFLETARDVLLQPELKRFAPEPRNFADKLGYAAVSGLPIPLAEVMHHLGKMRNKLAHRDESGIDMGDMQQLARLINLLLPLDPNPEDWRPIEKGFLELPQKFPGKRWLFGGGDLRVDFVICFSRFWFIAMAWLFVRAAANPMKGTA
ncbi:hypothetical protein D3C71_318400 [compost metagenome]